MADDTNEDSWLYGTSNPDSTTNEEERLGAENSTDEAGIEKANSQELIKAENEALAAVTQGDGVKDLHEKEDDPPGDELAEFEDPAHEMEEDEEATAAATVADTTDGDDEETKKKDQCTGGDDEDVEDDDDDDDSDDDINVVIGDIKAAPSTYNINKRSNLLAGANSQEKSKSAQVGKFSMEDFEGVGTINGVAAHEFSIDSLEDKPWRKPGADITDYFNYGFNEETWRSYCERQKRFRVAESGVGLASLTQNLNPQPERQTEGNIPSGVPPGVLQSGPMPIGPLGEQIQMPPPGMIPPSGLHQATHQGIPSRFTSMPRGPRPISQPGTKENAIQVMTAECREYSRPGQMPPNFGVQGPGEEAFFHEPEPFDYGYEPTQDSQWGGDNPNWVPSGIKELTPGPNSGPPQQISGPPGILPTPMGVPPPQMGGPPPQMRLPLSQPPLMGGMPPPNMGMGPPMGMMMGSSGPGGPSIHMPMGPPRMMGPNGPPERSEDDRERRRREREWDRERDRDRERVRRERSRSREKSRRRSKSREKERDKDRDKDRDKERDRDRDRERDRDRDRNDKVEDSERSDDERERRRRDRDRERERDRDRERSRRERSRSREKSRRRSKSRDKERERASKIVTSSSSSSSSRSDKKKSHRKEDEE